MLLYESFWVKKKAISTYTWLSTVTLLQAHFMFQDSTRYFMVWVLWTSFRLTPTSGKHYSLVCHTHFGSTGLSCDVPGPHASWLPLLGHMKDIHYWQKSHTREELMQQIMESADCIKRSDEIIRKAINYLLDGQDRAYRTEEYILTSDQYDNWKYMFFELI